MALLTLKVDTTYSEKDVWGSMRASSRRPMIPSNGAIAGLETPGREGLGWSGTVAGDLAGATWGKASVATTAQMAHRTEATRLIQKNVAWSRINPPTTAPSNEPTLVDICRMAKSLARR